MGRRRFEAYSVEPATTWSHRSDRDDRLARLERRRDAAELRHVDNHDLAIFRGEDELLRVELGYHAFDSVDVASTRRRPGHRDDEARAQQNNPHASPMSNFSAASAATRVDPHLRVSDANGFDPVQDRAPVEDRVGERMLRRVVAGAMLMGPIANPSRP